MQRWSQLHYLKFSCNLNVQKSTVLINALNYRKFSFIDTINLKLDKANVHLVSANPFFFFYLRK